MPNDTPSIQTANYEPNFHVVLHQPEIPGNTGAVGRTCVALQAKLWLIRPLGFSVDEKTLRRAGLDYWQNLNWEVVNHWQNLESRAQKTLTNAAETSEIQQTVTNVAKNPDTNQTVAEFAKNSESIKPVTSDSENSAKKQLGTNVAKTSECQQSSQPRFWMFTKTATRSLYSAKFQLGDWLVFGSETSGLPPSLLDDSNRNLAIPISRSVRSLNLSSAVAVAGYELARQAALFEQL